MKKTCYIMGIALILLILNYNMASAASIMPFQNLSWEPDRLTGQKGIAWTFFMQARDIGKIVGIIAFTCAIFLLIWNFLNGENAQYLAFKLIFMTVGYIILSSTVFVQSITTLLDSTTQALWSAVTSRSAGDFTRMFDRLAFSQKEIEIAYKIIKDDKDIRIIIESLAQTIAPHENSISVQIRQNGSASKSLEEAMDDLPPMDSLIKPFTMDRIRQAFGVDVKNPLHDFMVKDAYQLVITKFDEKFNEETKKIYWSNSAARERIKNSDISTGGVVNFSPSLLEGNTKISLKQPPRSIITKDAVKELIARQTLDKMHTYNLTNFRPSRGVELAPNSIYGGEKEKGVWAENNNFRTSGGRAYENYSTDTDGMFSLSNIRAFLMAGGKIVYSGGMQAATTTGILAFIPIAMIMWQTAVGLLPLLGALVKCVLLTALPFCIFWSWFAGPKMIISIFKWWLIVDATYVVFGMADMLSNEIIYNSSTASSFAQLTLFAGNPTQVGFVASHLIGALTVIIGLPLAKVFVGAGAEGISMGLTGVTAMAGAAVTKLYSKGIEQIVLPYGKRQ